MRSLIIVALALLLQACAYTSSVPSANGAHEVMPNRRIDAPAYVRIDPELSGLRRKVNTGFVCSGHTFHADAGQAAAESILQTMDGAFKSVVRVEAQSEARPDGYFLDFFLADFSPRLRFEQGFWTATAEANTETSIRVRAFNPVGTMVLQTTARGEARASSTAGGCGNAEGPISEASSKSIQRTMEDLVQKMINSRALTEK